MTQMQLAGAPHLPAFYSLRLVLAAAFRATRRAMAQARTQRRRAARARQALIELHRMDDRMLADIGASRSDLPWMSQRDAFARLADDAVAWNLAFGARWKH